MKNIIIYGYGVEGIKAYQWLGKNEEFHVLGFADNSPYKHGHYVNEQPISSIEKIKSLNDVISFSVVIAARKWWEIAKQCNLYGIKVEGVFENGQIIQRNYSDFSSLDLSEEIKLYAGDITDDIHMGEKYLYGLSINKSDERHIFHNIVNPYPLPDNCITRYEAEDVFEYIPKEVQISALNEIYRILKPGSCCRITLPDYNSPYKKKIVMTDQNGRLLFDPTGGGIYGEKGIEGGSVYFATYEDFKEVLRQTFFSKIDWLCYYSNDGVLHKKYIDMSHGYVKRVKNDWEDSYCIVVDCYK